MGTTDTWVSTISSSSLSSHVHAWQVGVSCRLAGVHSSAYILALDPPPQTFPYHSREQGEMTRSMKEQIEGVEGKERNRCDRKRDGKEGEVKGENSGRGLYTVLGKAKHDKHTRRYKRGMKNRE